MQLFSEGPAVVFPLLAQAQVAQPSAVWPNFVYWFQKYPIWAAFWVVVTQALAVACYWLASKFVADYEVSRLGQAIKVWFFLFLSSLVTEGIVGAVAIYAGQSQALVAVVAGIALIVSLILLFVIPMHVYAIGFLRAIGFWVLTILSGLAGGTAIAVVAALGFVGLMHGDLKGLAEQLKSGKALAISPGKATPPPAAPKLLPGEALAADRTKSIAERTAGINQMYAELTAHFKVMSKDDPAQVDAYNAENARYQEKLAQLNADSAAAVRAQAGK